MKSLSDGKTQYPPGAGSNPFASAFPAACRGAPLARRFSIERVVTLVDDCLGLKEGSNVAYRIRTSARARNVRLQLAADGLTVVVPRHFNLRRIPAILERKRTWIEAHLKRFADLAAVRPPLAILPESIELPALGESWRVEYRPARTRKVGVIQEHPGWITVYGAVDDRDACREVLKQWLPSASAGGARSVARPPGRRGRVPIRRGGHPGAENAVGELFGKRDDQSQLQAPLSRTRRSPLRSAA